MESQIPKPDSVGIERLIIDIINHKHQERMISKEQYDESDAREDYQLLHEKTADEVVSMWFSRVGSWLNSCANEPWFDGYDVSEIVDSQFECLVNGDEVAYSYHNPFTRTDYENISESDVGSAWFSGD